MPSALHAFHNFSETDLTNKPYVISFNFTTSSLPITKHSSLHYCNSHFSFSILACSAKLWYMCIMSQGEKAICNNLSSTNFHYKQQSIFVNKSNRAINNVDISKSTKSIMSTTADLSCTAYTWY